MYLEELRAEGKVFSAAAVDIRKAGSKEKEEQNEGNDKADAAADEGAAQHGAGRKKIRRTS